jgi:hypothetical protein
MNNQTNEKDLANSGDEAENSVLDRLRPIWQGRQGSNLRPSVLETDATTS